MSKPAGDQVVTFVPGDGVWPELMNSVKEVFKQAQVPVKFEEKFIRYTGYSLFNVIGAVITRSCYEMLVL